MFFTEGKLCTAFSVNYLSRWSSYESGYKNVIVIESSYHKLVQRRKLDLNGNNTHAGFNNQCIDAYAVKLKPGLAKFYKSRGI